MALKAKRAWTVLLAGVLTHQFTCSDGEYMSEECDRWIERRPVLTRAFIAVVALHLSNAWPDDRFDVMSFEFWKGCRDAVKRIKA